MRFRFLPSNSPAMRERLRLEAQFEQFWAMFRDRYAEIKQMIDSRGPIADFMHTHLPMTQGALEWEFGPSPDGKDKLCFSVAGNAGLRGVCDRLIELAPEIEGWTFLGHRQPEPDSSVDMLVVCRRGESLGKTWFDVKAHPAQGLAIDVYSDRVGGEANDRQFFSACLLLEIVIGEEAFERWVGPISLRPVPMSGLLFKKPSPPPGAVPRDGLRARAESIIQLLREKLPNVPRSRIIDGDASHRALITLSGDAPPETKPGQQVVAFSFELDVKKVPEREEYPERSDLVFGTVREMPLLNATLASVFDSARFSRVGETFAYLKINRGTWTDLVEPRAAIEDALESVLRERDLGAVWGGGSGRRYSYIELSLNDVEPAIDVIHDVLNSSPHRPDAAWLLFHDRTLKEEYVDLIFGEDVPPPKEATA